MRAIIDPHIRLVDNSPTSPSQLGEVNGGDIIGIVLVATANTSEQLPISVLFIDSSTAWTPLRSIFWLNVYYWDTSLQTLVFNHLLKSSKSPAMEGSVVAFSMLSVVSNPIQFLHHDEISASNQRVNESSADLVQNCVYPSPLPTSQPFKPPLCRGGALRLEGASELPKMSPPVLDWLTINLKPVGSYQDVVNPYIYTNRIIPLWLWNFHQNGDMQVEFSAISSVNEFGISYRILQKLSLVITNGKLWFNPAVDCGYGNSLLVSEQGEQSFIQIHRRLLELMRKLKSFTSFIVNEMVQCYWVEAFSFPCNLADIVTGISESLNSIHEFFKFFFGAIELADHSLGSFHRNSYMYLRYLSLSRNSSPPYRTGSPCEVIR